MRSLKGHWRSGLTVLALTAALIPAMAGSANASFIPISCTAAGTVFQGDTIFGIDTWSVAGKGSCQGDLEGTYFLDFTGAGTSRSRGLCDASGVVLDLKIHVIGTLTNAFSGLVEQFDHDWVSPATTYPVATPFAIQGSVEPCPSNCPEPVGVIGAGNFFNHIFLQCDGSPVAQFTFAFGGVEVTT